MRLLLFYILFLTISCQPEANSLSSMVLVQWFNGLNSTSKSQKPNVKNNNSVDYYESQILLADSLYKNYLPQYNFEEVKAAVAFFESIRNEELGIRNYEQEKTIPDFTSLIPNYQCAKAHYYHAVGLSERDDVVGACEHYLRALEIMEPLVGTSPLWRPKTNDKGLKDSDKRLKDSDKRQRAKEKRQKVSVAEPVEATKDGVVPSTSSGTAYPKTVDRCPSSVDNPQDYEKIRFLALIYTRLGDIFLDESNCELAIINYKIALRFSDVLGDNIFRSNTLKYIGNGYQLFNKPDSALYYYNETLKSNKNITNKLDVEKCIAQILYYKGERDSAYVLLKNNLREINNENLKYSYHHTIGDMYFVDKKYDSALYYLEESLDDDIITSKIAFTTHLSAIYDSIGDYSKRDYYDNFSVKMLLNHANKDVDNKQLQVLYDNYKERKKEREISMAKAKTRKLIIATGLGVFAIVVFILINIKYMHRKQSNKLKSEIDDYVNRIDNYSKDIENKNIIINQKEQLINDYQMTNDKKDKIIDKQKKEIDRIKTKISKKKVNIEAYYASDICKKIVERKDGDFSCLKEDELALLLKSADEHLDNISERLHNSFSGLNKNDIYTVCLLVLNVEKGKLQYLLGKDRKTIWNRLNKIKRLMNVDENQDLFLYIKDNFLN